LSVLHISSKLTYEQTNLLKIVGVIMVVYSMTINGQSIQGNRNFEVINPATEEVIATAPECSEEQIDMAVAAATRAFDKWRHDATKRRQALNRCAEALLSNVESLTKLLTEEQGKPLRDSNREIRRSAELIQEFAALEFSVDTLQDNESRRVELHRKPLGVVAAITPWNVPIILATLKFAPALLAGNTVVLKPSPFTPLTTLKIGELFQEVLPPGVFNTISGGDSVGERLTHHPAIQKISITGSVQAGKQVAVAGAKDLKRVTLELGGNDPAIVLGDVDPKWVAEKLFEEAFWLCGQVCMAVKRVYVHEDVFGPIVTELSSIAKGTKLGNGMDPETTMGPLNNKPQFERVIELVEDAKQAGAMIVTGGVPLPGRGYFFPPTIVTNISEGVRLVDEEQFGPALPIMPFKDVEQALERANATQYGLGGSVWTSDIELGKHLARLLDCGTAWVNQHGSVGMYAPFGGVKWSGIGYEYGNWGLDEYFQYQILNSANSPARR
jgi:acyl-CoA reductase-like NAD-dependent aldehyde dehydrogenase